jgi:type IV pilus assembly protein PilA
MPHPSKGFTLLELMIVIVIIALLSGLAIANYQKFRQKAVVASYALPSVRGCALWLASFCAESRGESNETIDLSTCSTVRNFCNDNNTQTPPGNYTIIFNGTLNCSQSGHVANGTIIGKIENINLYQVVCTFDNQTLKCDVKAQ